MKSKIALMTLAMTFSTWAFTAISAVNMPKEATLSLLSYEGYTDPQMNDIFSNLMLIKYGVKLIIKNKNITNENQLYDLVRAKQIDLFTPGLDIINEKKFDFISKKIAEPLDIANIPNYQHLIPKHHKPAYLVRDQKVYGAAFTAGAYWIVYRKSKFSSPPNSYKFFWNPKYKNRYAIGDYPAHNAYLVALALGKTGDDIYSYDALFNDPQYRKKYLEFHVNRKSNWNMIDREVDYNNVDIALTLAQAFPKLNKRSDRWGITQPKEGQLGWVDHWMIGYSLHGNPAKKLLAEEFINFTLSSEYQRKVLLEANALEPVNRDVLKQVDWTKVPELAHLKNIDLVYSLRTAFIKSQNTRARAGFEINFQLAMEGRPLDTPLP